jgi:outer membrane receptor protein involved in Fe transport
MKTGRRERSGGFLALLCFLLSLGALIGTANILQAQERFGSITGVLKDASGGVLPGATVVITNKETGRSVTLVTDGSGTYRVAIDLDPGRYSVRAEMAGFTRSEVPDVVLLLGKSLEVNMTMKVGNISEAVQVTAEMAPLISLRTTTVAHNVTAEEFDRMPKARSFQGVVRSSPSVNSGDIENGYQVNGASAAENAFIIDGVVTNSLIHGGARQDAVFEYLQEVQVKTGGISAEYGGALGGVISAVTKSGGNNFHGEGHYYFSGNSISAGPVNRLVLDTKDDKTVAYYQDEKQPLKTHEVGGTLGGPVVKNRLFFFGSLSPRYVRQTNTYKFGNGAETGEIARKQTFMSAFGKLTWDQKRVRTSGSVLLTPTTSTGSLPAYNGSGANVISSTLASNQPNTKRGFKSPQTNASGTVDFILTSSSVLGVRGGYFRDNYMDTGVPLLSPVVYQASSIGLAGVPADLQGPIGMQNTPRVQINKHDLTQRGYVNVDYSKSGRMAGDHSFKAGFGNQHTSNDVDLSYPGGGYVFVWWNTGFTSNATGVTDRGTYGYYEVDDVATRGKAASDIWSIYGQDQWNLNDRLTLNLGLRTEREVIPSFRTDIKKEGFHFGFKDKMAPRVGFSYDVRGDGKVKAYASYGRYYDWTKFELSRGAFGADVWTIKYRSLDTTDVFSLSGTNAPGRDLWNPSVPNSFRDRRVPNFDRTDPNIKPMRQDDYNAGLEYQVGRTSVVTVHFVHNILDRTIEDMGVLINGDEVYKYVNPGEGIAVNFVPSGLTPPFAAPKPKRQYDALELTYNRRLSNNWFGGASYVLSRLYGNYSGLDNSDEIRTPTIGSTYGAAQQSGGTIARNGSSAHRAWDLDEVVVDSKGNLDVEGRLATDRPHVVKLYGGYAFPMGTEIGLNFYAGSGTPLTTLVGTFNQIPVMVNGRGDLGRTPILTQTDLLIAHSMKMAGARKLGVEFNIQNLFNQKTVRHLFTSVNRTDGNPRQSSGINLSNTDLSKGFDYVSLLAKSADGASAGAPGLPNNAYDPRFKKDDLFNPGLTARLGIRFTF